MTPATPHEPSGSWDSIHVFEAAERGRQAHYKLTSTVMLQLVTRRGGDVEGAGKYPGGEKKGGHVDGWTREGEVSLSGSMTRQVCLCFFSFGHSFVSVLQAAVQLATTAVELANGVFSLNSQTEQDWPLQDSSSHIGNTGRMIEEMEIKMRNLLQEVRLFAIPFISTAVQM